MTETKAQQSPRTDRTAIIKPLRPCRGATRDECSARSLPSPPRQRQARRRNAPRARTSCPRPRVSIARRASSGCAKRAIAGSEDVLTGSKANRPLRLRTRSADGSTRSTRRSKRGNLCLRISGSHHHRVGDEVISAIAQRLCLSVRVEAQLREVPAHRARGNTPDRAKTRARARWLHALEIR